MQILVDRLTETPTHHRLQAEPARWALLGAPIPELFEGVLPHVEIRAHHMGSDLFLEGELFARLALTCSRCLADYCEDVRESFRLLLEPAGDRVPADPEASRALDHQGLCIGDELEAGWFRGAEIHLEAFCLELMSGIVPVKPLCREDCRGLCPHCGVERNVRKCDCPRLHSSSPFAVLSALRSDSREGEP